ncbi:MAG TPA: transglutaminaseTgpA domain-containing protein, partial [Virgibacillus sp.]|nr:transglutaminaseTgpA domain-containing protein [Virgibacillus sp.]
MKGKETRLPLLYKTMMYVCGMFLFLEWIYPIKNYGEENNLRIFIIFTLFCFLISLVQLKWYVSFLLKGSGLLIMINMLYYDHDLFNGAWLYQLISELQLNFKIIWAGNYEGTTDLFRSVLFFLLIWLISYLIHYWFVEVKRIFVFVILTFIYIMILDTFTHYDAVLPIIRTFIISFLALGVTNFVRVMKKESIHFTRLKSLPTWIIPIILAVVFTSLLGFLVPKPGPQWSDPVPYLKGISENANGLGKKTTERKVGYGEDDTQLGGSFIQDDTPVFQAAVSEEHYWRIETKDEYTGKGWESSEPTTYEQIEHESVQLNIFTENVVTSEAEAIIEFQGNVVIDKLVYPYGLQQIKDFDDGKLFFDKHSEAIQREQRNKSPENQYRITYNNPLFNRDELRETGEQDSSVSEQYTNLPSELPDRVHDLAEEITSSADNRYDRVVAIEKYFGKNGFTYETNNIPIPENEEDYVDQFLFESKKGYCDNYSTAMVVMLRSIDIPARWAKGFTSGEKIATDINEADSLGLDVYEVTNSNAHSWVEVYFPEVGWVPFEPTQGFDNLADFEENDDPKEEEDSEPEEELEAPESEDTEEKTPDELTENEEDLIEAETGFTIAWWHVALSFVFIGLLVVIIYKKRFYLKTLYIQKKLKSHPDDAFEQAYQHLLSLLSYKSLPRGH